MTDMTPVPSVLLDQLREAFNKQDADRPLSGQLVFKAARAVVDAVQPTAEDEPSRVCTCGHLKAFHKYSTGLGICDHDDGECVNDCQGWVPSPAVCPTEAEDEHHRDWCKKPWKGYCTCADGTACTICHEAPEDCEHQPVKDTPAVRVASSLDDLKVGQHVAWLDGGSWDADSIDDAQDLADWKSEDWPDQVVILSDPAPSVPTAQERAEQAWQAWNVHENFGLIREAVFKAGFAAAVAGDAREQEDKK